MPESPSILTSGIHLRETFRYIAETSGLGVEQSGEYIGFITDSQNPGYNYLVGVGEKEESFRPLIKNFQHNNTSFVWFSDPLTATLEQSLIENGLVMCSSLTSVVCDLTQDLPFVETDPTISVVPVTTKALFNVWCENLAVVFNKPLVLVKKFFGGLGERSFETLRMQLFLARKEDTYVGSSALDIQGKIGGCYWGAVLPEWRQQGVGLAMVRKRQDIARTQGCSTLVAHCLSASLGICLKAGFREENPMALYKWDNTTS